MSLSSIPANGSVDGLDDDDDDTCSGDFVILGFETGTDTLVDDDVG